MPQSRQDLPSLRSCTYWRLVLLRSLIACRLRSLLRWCQRALRWAVFSFWFIKPLSQKLRGKSIRTPLPLQQTILLMQNQICYQTTYKEYSQCCQYAIEVFHILSIQHTWFGQYLRTVSRRFYESDRQGKQTNGLSSGLICSSSHWVHATLQPINLVYDDSNLCIGLLYHNVIHRFSSYEYIHNQDISLLDLNYNHHTNLVHLSKICQAGLILQS